MDYIVSLFAEDVSPLIWLIALVVLILAIGLVGTGRGKFLVWIGVLLVLALLLLLVASGYAAGRVHGQVGYRVGYRSGYRQGHADGSRLSSTVVRTAAEGHETRSEGERPSESRQFFALSRATVHKVRQLRG